MRALAVMFALAAAQGQGTGDRIPTVHGTTLAGGQVDLPEALHGKQGVLVVGFSQGSREAVAAWGRRLAAGFDPGMAYFEMPVLAGVPRVLRGVVVGRIRAAVAEPVRPHFLPLVEDEAGWRRVAGFEAGAPDAAYVLVVNGAGVVRWRTHEAATDGLVEELKRRLIF